LRHYLLFGYRRNSYLKILFSSERIGKGRLLIVVNKSAVFYLAYITFNCFSNHSKTLKGRAQERNIFPISPLEFLSIPITNMPAGLPADR
jgi:hypothetical protein